jgi:putative membrane protein
MVTDLSWKKAFFATPGPLSFKEAFLLTLKGICMGSADIIPGVSGGTIALITGIYEDLITAIKSVDLRFVQLILTLKLKSALSRLHVRFLLSLFLGIALAILSLARLMNYMLHHHPVEIWSLFFGLIAASIVVVGRYIEAWSLKAGLVCFVGTLIAFCIVSMIPLETPNDLWFIFICGIIAICAMILPGLSGAFILLILGKYEFITATLKNPFAYDHILIIAVFCLGCLTGLTAFSRLLKYFFSRFHNLTLAFLMGLMIGSMPKIWPWKEVVTSKIIDGKAFVLESRNVWPQRGLEGDVAIAMVLVATGFVAVLFLERLTFSKSKLAR